MATLPRGQRLLVRYDEVGEPWHERLILWHVQAQEYVVATPTEDIFVEDFGDDNADIAEFRLLGARGGLPTGVSRAACFMFGPGVLTEAKIASLYARGEEFGMEQGLWNEVPPASNVRLKRPAGKAKARVTSAEPPGAPVPPAPIPPPVAAPKAAAMKEGSWRVASHGYAVGSLGTEWSVRGNEVFAPHGHWLAWGFDVASAQYVPLEWVPDHDQEEWMTLRGFPKSASASGGLPGTHSLDAMRANAGLGAGEKSSDEDARTLPIVCESSGERWREFRDVVNASEESVAEHWPIEGPRTMLWVLKYMRKYGGGPLARHTKWVHEFRLSGGDPHAYIHEVLSEVFELATCWDQLDVSNLASFERLARWYQDTEAQHRKEEPKGPSDPFVSGLGRAGGGVCYCPALQVYVTEKVAAHTAVAKEKRKAREEKRESEKHEAAMNAAANKGGAKKGGGG